MDIKLAMLSFNLVSHTQFKLMSSGARAHTQFKLMSSGALVGLT